MTVYLHRRTKQRKFCHQRGWSLILSLDPVQFSRFSCSHQNDKSVMIAKKGQVGLAFFIQWSIIGLSNNIEVPQRKCNSYHSQLTKTSPPTVQCLFLRRFMTDAICYSYRSHISIISSMLWTFLEKSFFWWYIYFRDPFKHLHLYSLLKKSWASDQLTFLPRTETVSQFECAAITSIVHPPVLSPVNTKHNVQTNMQLYQLLESAFVLWLYQPFEKRGSTRHLTRRTSSHPLI